VNVVRRLAIAAESWPIAGAFTIARGSKTEARVVVVTLVQDGAVGRGECVPYARYGETVEGAVAALEAARGRIEAGLPRSGVAAHIRPMAARNALDCALWDLEAKRTGIPVWKLAGIDEPRPLVTAYTLSLGDPGEMAEAAARERHRPLLKLKLGREGDIARLEAVRRAAPDVRLVVDANEGWSEADLPGLLAACAAAGVELVEQPLPAAADGALARLKRDVPVCADESAHGPERLAKLVGRYDAVNIKLDKTGGLTEALAMADAAHALGFEIMIGCMVATSLSMAPASLAAQGAAFVDLDGPLLLARDREPAIRYDGSFMHPPGPALWG
jgi:L-alanine-DL-glutamate epimerase-like enolase superfamily enzyme